MRVGRSRLKGDDVNKKREAEFRPRTKTWEGKVKESDQQEVGEKKRIRKGSANRKTGEKRIKERKGG